MEEEIKDQYIIVGYVDDVEEASRLGQKNDFSQGVIKGIQSVHDELVELEPLLKTEADYKRLKAEVEKLVADLVKSCREGDESLSLGNMRQLRDRVGALKAILSKGK
ncbi:MAG: hypothetical protein JRI52_07500 [Deltaproteobacteria bacterium]|nr:hypothetical protein [Deltaproteobacteria bacterium]